MKKLKSLLIIITLVIMTSCENEKIEELTIPIKISLSNAATAEKTFTTIKIKGEIVPEEGNNIVEKGVCWSKNNNPTINDNKIIATNNVFEILIEDLTSKTEYFVRGYAIDAKGIHYSDSQIVNTLSLENTTWKFSTYYPPNQNSTGVTIESTVIFYADGTTKYDEIGAGQGYFITFGTWSLNGNTLSYIWEGNNTGNSTYVYTGNLSGLTQSGTFTHTLVPGTFTATQL